MRHVVTAFVLSFLTISTLYATETSSSKEPVRASHEIGRYQLFQGTYTTIDLKYRQASSAYSAVFLLDTSTGTVKRYVNRIDEDGRYIETWLPTDITPQADFKKTNTP
jgi:hypothetical protein